MKVARKVQVIISQFQQFGHKINRVLTYLLTYLQVARLSRDAPGRPRTATIVRRRRHSMKSAWSVKQASRCPPALRHRLITWHSTRAYATSITPPPVATRYENIRHLFPMPCLNTSPHKYPNIYHTTPNIYFLLHYSIILYNYILFCLLVVFYC